MDGGKTLIPNGFVALTTHQSVHLYNPIKRNRGLLLNGILVTTRGVLLLFREYRAFNLGRSSDVSYHSQHQPTRLNFKYHLK
jgi:hypothetical protein